MAYTRGAKRMEMFFQPSNGASNEVENMEVDEPWNEVEPMEVDPFDEVVPMEIEYTSSPAPQNNWLLQTPAKIVKQLSILSRLR